MPTEDENSAEHAPDAELSDALGESVAEVEPEPTSHEPALATSHDRWTFADADVMFKARGVRLVLIAGEPAAGKTTLLVGLWNRLIRHGRVGSVALAGTRSAIAFERRAWLSRVESGVPIAQTERTFLSESGWLHLQLIRTTGITPDLLLSDIAGEQFTRVRSGAAVDEVIPEIDRVDVLAVVVDGAALSSSAKRGTVVANTRRLLRRLVEARAGGTPLRVVLVLTKTDVVTEEGRAAWAALVAECADQMVLTALETAAGPADGSEPVNLEQLVDALCAPIPSTTEPAGAHRPVRSVRTIGRIR